MIAAYRNNFFNTFVIYHYVFFFLLHFSSCVFVWAYTSQREKFKRVIFFNNYQRYNLQRVHVIEMKKKKTKRKRNSEARKLASG